MTLEFKIQKWDNVTCSEDNSAKPIIYIKPTIEMLDYFRNNQNNIWLQIQDSGSKYDGIVFNGYAEKANGRPNQTLNKFVPNGMYIITLQTASWKGMPEKNGQVKFLNGVITHANIKEHLQLGLDEFVRTTTTTSTDDNKVCKSVCNTICNLTGKDNCIEYCENVCKDMDNRKFIFLCIGLLAFLCYIFSGKQ